ncbi:MAG TPA: hypothetical protein VGN56_01395, partial [Candidatus Paceibacterota bacterium]|nr:hypothetical protein [Candidatus Paceibacterota bacterium]
LETVFSPEFMKEDLVNLGQRQIYLSLMIDGVGSRPFSAATLPPIEPPPHTFKKEVIEMSRQQFGNKRAGIEESIFTELASTDAENGPPEPAKRAYAKPAGGQGTGAPRSSVPRNSEPRANSDRPPRPQEERPRRDERPAAPRAQRPQQAAPSAQKTPEDLKAILRGMTESAAKEKEQLKPKPKDGPSPLKGALADVLKNEPPAQAAPAPRPHPHVVPESASGPFEVPEDTLRALFREK